MGGVRKCRRRARFDGNIRILFCRRREFVLEFKVVRSHVAGLRELVRMVDNYYVQSRKDVSFFA
jgi:hypothetical protein